MWRELPDPRPRTSLSLPAPPSLDVSHSDITCRHITVDSRHGDTLRGEEGQTPEPDHGVTTATTGPTWKGFGARACWRRFGPGLARPSLLGGRIINTPNLSPQPRQAQEPPPEGEGGGGDADAERQEEAGSSPVAARQNEVPSRPRTSPEEAEKAGRPWWLKGKERREGRRREGPQKEGGPGTREEAGRRAGAPGPEGEGAALSPESALALPGRGPGAQVYQLGRPRRHAPGQALSPVPGGPSRARTDMGSIGGHWPGQVCWAPSPSSLLAAAFVQVRLLRCGPRHAGALLEALPP